jgi:hypothetical protein
MNRTDLLDGFSNMALHRAFCAFSQTFDWRIQFGPEQLMWSVLALETLYIRGRAGMADQLKDTVTALLGDVGTVKISKMYDFRSRFIHGDMDFPPLGFYALGVPEYHKFGDGMSEAIYSAISVLVRTLQEIISRDWSGLAFTHVPMDSQ